MKMYAEPPNPNLLASADYHTCLRLIAEGCKVLKIVNTGSGCPEVIFSNEHGRTAAIAAAFSGESVVVAIDKLAKLAQRR